MARNRSREVRFSGIQTTGDFVFIPSGDDEQKRVPLTGQLRLQLIERDLSRAMLGLQRSGGMLD
jgi:hypothetical protein